MTEDKPVKWQGWAFIAMLIAIGFMLGNIAGLGLGIGPLYLSASIVLCILFYGMWKDWAFNVELVERPQHEG